MKKEIIGEASTIEEAKERAVTLLAAPADADISFEIVAMPQKKVLGLFGGSPAKVKASYDDGRPEPKSEPVQQQPDAKKTTSQPSNAAAPAKKEVQDKPKTAEKPAEKEVPAAQATPAEPKKKAESAYPSDAVTAQAIAYLEEILQGLKVENAAVSAKQSNDGLFLAISCEDYGIIIGRRGETLDSIQYLVSLLANRDASDYIRVTINVGNYREKREETLRHLANKNASHVLRSGRRVVLEPMNPYERRIIHTTVQDIDGVNSRSVGSGADRKVMIELAEGVQPTGASRGRESRDRDDRGGRYNNRDRGSRGPRPAAPATPTRKLTKEELPKFGKIQ